MVSSMLGVISKKFHYVNNSRFPLLTIIRCSSRVRAPKAHRGTIKHRNLIESSCESLAARGFLRAYKPYEPPVNVKEKVIEICNKIFGASFDQKSPLSRQDKFSLLNSCFEELNHSVPNSCLHKLENIKDVIEFYETPVSTTTPYDDLLNQELPPNLHIIKNYLRFNPGTDTKFKGISAFPRSSTIVTGLRYKEKYSSYKAKSPYLDSEVHFDDPTRS